MATVTGLTKERMLEIEAQTVVTGTIKPDGHLWLQKFDGTPIDCGTVVGPVGPQGPQGIPGAAGISSIPGEVKLWPGATLPAIGTYGRWVWADGAVYVVAEHPLAAGNISPAWKTAHGASDPGAANLRVPDLRGLTPAGLDAMPGGARANRMTRAVAITIAGKTGEETHVVTIAEMPSHNHGGTVNVSVSGGISGGTDGVGDHAHGYHAPGQANGDLQQGTAGTHLGYVSNVLWNDMGTGGAGGHSHNVGGSFSGGGSGSIGSQGGGGAHENVQPTVFVPYIVYLDN